MITILKGKYNGSEDDLQMACMNYLRYEYPELFAVHIANERKTQARQNSKGQWYTPLGNKLKAKGVKSGMPDIMIFDSILKGTAYGWGDHAGLNDYSEIYKGLAVELKVFPNTLKPTQKEVLEKLSARGWLCYVIYTLDLFMQTIEKYYKK